MVRRATARAALALWLLAAAARGDGVSARAHFQVGVKLFETRNYAGALAEFEEAYRLQPTPSSLQNIALCQRAMFRYAEAIDALERMLRDHAATVDPEDARAAREAIEEMRPMVAEVTFVLTPADATLLVDGRAVAGEERRLLRLSVGEHRVVAESPMHERYDRTMRFAGGARELAVTLEGDVGELTVVAEDAEAAIAVDGVPRTFGSWTGELPASARHIVQVYRTGYTTTTLEVSLERGEKRTLRAALGPRTKDPNASTPFPYQPPPTRREQQGIYGLLTATGYVLSPDPSGFRLPSRDGHDGTYFGLRGGYRFSSTFGLEAMGEFGKHSIGPGCYTPPQAPPSCDAQGAPDTSYELWGQRFGVNARFMTPGERFRFMAATGVGGAYHTIKITTPQATTQPQGESSALNAYLFLEAGLELSFSGAIVGGTLALAVDGINNLKLGPASQRVYADDRNITMIGLGIRVGYGRW